MNDEQNDDYKRGFADGQKAERHRIVRETSQPLGITRCPKCGYHTVGAGSKCKDAECPMGLPHQAAFA